MNDMCESSSADQLHTMKAVIQGGIRLGAWAGQADLFALMRGRIDGVLAEACREAWTKSKSESCGPKAWLDANERFWKLVLPEKEVMELMGATPPVDWTKYSEQIDAIVSNSFLGKSLFEFTIPAVVTKLIQTELVKCVDELAKTVAVKEEHVVACRNKEKEAIAKIANVSSLPERRQIIVMYRGWEIPVWVKSVEEQVE
eukprot:1003856-Amphidinium_carterae.1